MATSTELTGPEWLSSDERRAFDAFFATYLQTPALMLSSMALSSLSHYGYKIFTQKRLGKGNIPFDMLKLQTLRDTDIPLDHKTKQKNIPPAARMVRALALDELVQIVHVSQDPSKPGLMSFIGPRRPQMPQELRLREQVLKRAGYKRLFREYMKIHELIEPSIFGPESFVKSGDGISGTPQYYKECLEGVIWHYQHASMETDTRIFIGVLLLGANILGEASIPDFMD